MYSLRATQLPWNISTQDVYVLFILELSKQNNTYENSQRTEVCNFAYLGAPGGILLVSRQTPRPAARFRIRSRVIECRSGNRQVDILRMERVFRTFFDPTQLSCSSCHGTGLSCYESNQACLSDSPFFFHSRNPHLSLEYRLRCREETHTHAHDVTQ